MDASTLRTWWWNRQGLDGSLAGKTAAEVLERAGWARSVAGVGPYLALFARAGIGREAADAAVAKLAIHELPAARNCTYVVAAGDFALALRVGQEFQGGDFRAAQKLGVTDKEIEKLCEGVLQALEGGALDPEGIRERTAKLWRNLGEPGKKTGVGTTLPLALGRLQARGDIRRVPVNGRLDQQRYRYTLWKPNPLARFKMSPAEAYVELARRFFRWVGPATQGEFQWFSGLGVKASREALSPLGLVPCAPGSDRLLFPDDVDAFRSVRVAKKSQYALVSSLDPLCAARRDVRSLLDPADLARKVRLEKKVGTLGGLADLPDHAIFDRGRLVGLWEFDAASQSIVYAPFGVRDAALAAAVQATEEFVPKSRTLKLDALRKMR
jgi:hypothetical protein